MKKTIKVILITIGIITLVFIVWFMGAMFEAGYINSQNSIAQGQITSYLNDMIILKNNYKQVYGVCAAATTDLINGDTSSYRIKEGEVNVLLNEINNIEGRYPIRQQ